MATSIRRIRFPTIEIAPVEISSEEPHEKEKVKRPQRKKDRKLRDFHKAPDRYSFSHLAKILTGGERIAMLNAVDRLKGRSRVLVELALFSNFQFVRLAAVSHLAQDAEALIDIAKFCHYDDTRSSAVDELSANVRALAEIACSSLFSATRLDAVNILADPGALAEVATRSPHRDSRSSALDKICGSPPALRKVAEESSYRSARMTALENLASDIGSLCSLVLSKNTEVKKAAASKLSAFVEELDDADALLEIAKVSPSEDARYIAVGRLSNDPYSLRTVISESQFTDARTTALMLLSDMVADLDDPDVLSDVAMLSPYPDCRTAAIERLVGQSSALHSVATKARFKDSRELALLKLRGDVETLKSVSRLSKYSDTRKKAHGMVAKPEVFASELAKILG
jgi:hypothetical protein